MKKVALLSLLALVVSAPALAAGYKSAGCGLGSMLIQDDGIMQIFAATTNGTSANQTFGITSGTSNCTGAGGYVKAEVAQEMYVSSNFDSLSQEMAQGSGEHLSALASLMGCEQNSHAQFSAVLKQNYRSIASQASTPEQMLQSVKSTVSSDSNLSSSCSNS